MLTFKPVRERDDIIKDLIDLENQRSIFNIKRDKLIKELLDTNEEEYLNDTNQEE